MVEQTGPFKSKFGLENHGFSNLSAAHWNLSTPALYEHALRRGEGELAYGGGFVTTTGEYTGRSPKDKFIVDEPSSSGDIWWGPVNNKISAEHFDIVHKRMLAYFQGREAFVRDVYAGADPDYRLKVRVVTEQSWHSLFTGNMFIPPANEALHDFEPDFTVIQAPNFNSIPAIDGTGSEVFVLLNFAKRLVLVGGSHYTGEIKKTIFSVLNYLLPARGVLPMHCSSNIGPKGDTAIFFGLSGTGKTTLSSEPTRKLIGDDEHGWSDNGVFNFEGGCYAKAIKLSAEAEPEIHAACFRFGTVLENVVLKGESRMPDFDDGSLTENTRASYPLSFIPNTSDTGMGGHPENIVMLTADAFGVLPPISQLSAEQAMYHFLSGYTAKVAGTERGLGNEPEATFSTCFGAPFLPRHPTVYAKLLGEKIARHGAKCWLVNTGWSGGAYGVGERMKIAHTRGMLRAALEGKLATVASRPDPNFGMLVPESCPDVPQEVLNPKSTWNDKKGYDDMARNLAQRFEQNFKQFEDAVDDKVNAAGIHAAA
ncbi:MAG: phosphoenolpyruvate carboxykinase [Rhodospirillales bacterium]|nr:phosphoenolpyruvate carboxykinase [Rhodospirillales bacterium]